MHFAGGEMSLTNDQRVNDSRLMVATNFSPLLPLSGEIDFSFSRMWTGLVTCLDQKNATELTLGPTADLASKRTDSS